VILNASIQAMKRVRKAEKLKLFIDFKPANFCWILIFWPLLHSRDQRISTQIEFWLT